MFKIVCYFCSKESRCTDRVLILSMSPWFDVKM